jgi:hypothetical protein
MATNKKISELTEFAAAQMADDDLIVMVDVSDSTTKKVQASTFRATVSGVSTLSADAPLSVDAATGDVTMSLSTVAVAKGGTGATDAATARTNLGLGSIATQASSSVSITGGSISGITDLAVADGGTGVSTLTDGGILLGSGTGAVTAMAVLADGEMIVGDGTTDPVAESGATLRTSIGVGTGDSPQFAGLTSGGNIVSDTDSTDDLGTTGVRWANLFVDGITATDQVTATGFTGTLDGVLGGGTPAAASVTTLSASGVTTVAAGTALLPSIVPTGDTNTGVWFPAADTVAASTAGTERLRIDSAGNVGIGTTSPSSYGKFVVSGGTTSIDPQLTIESTAFNASQGCSLNFARAGFTQNIQARISTQDNGVAASNLLFSTKVDGTAGALTERMRIDSSGNVGIGTTAPGAKLSVHSGNIGIDGGGSAQQFYGRAGNIAGTNTTGGVLTVLGHSPNADFTLGTPPYDGTNFVGAAGLMARGFSEAGQYRGSLEFFTKTATTANATSRMIITHDGNVGIGTTSPTEKLDVVGSINASVQILGPNGSAATPSISSSGETNAGLFFGDNGVASYMGMSTGGSERMRIDPSGFLLISATSKISGHLIKGINASRALDVYHPYSDAAQAMVAFYSDVTSAQALKCIIRADGDLENVNNSYGAYSDRKLKQDETLAASQWNDIKAIGEIVKKFRLKDAVISDPNAPYQIGVVAQDIEAISPGLVDEVADANNDGETVKVVKYSVLYMKAVKALGEALQRIETLEARVALLEAK